MAHHKVKSWSYLYQAIKSGAKTHDVRDMTDRPYAVGDTMTLCEFDQTIGAFTGDETDVQITYITDRNIPCAYSSAVLSQDYGILSVKLREPVVPCAEGVDVKAVLTHDGFVQLAKSVINEIIVDKG